MATSWPGVIGAVAPLPVPRASDAHSPATRSVIRSHICAGVAGRCPGRAVVNTTATHTRAVWACPGQVCATSSRNAPARSGAPGRDSRAVSAIRCWPVSGNDSMVTVAAWTWDSCGREANQWPHASVHPARVSGSTRAALSTGHSRQHRPAVGPGAQHPDLVPQRHDHPAQLGAGQQPGCRGRPGPAHGDPTAEHRRGVAGTPAGLGPPEPDPGTGPPVPGAPIAGPDHQRQQPGHGQHRQHQPGHRGWPGCRPGTPGPDR